MKQDVGSYEVEEGQGHMPNKLSLSRAARLAGVSRGELQKRIREEDAETFEGQLTIEILLKLYPHINMDADPVLERVQRIKAAAKPKRHYSDGWMPDPEVLMSRLNEFQHTLVQTKSALNASETVLQETLGELSDAMEESPEHLRDRVAECVEKLEKVMQRAERADDARAALFARNAMLKIVTSSIRVLPSGHEFFLEGNDSILDAGLKAGLYIDYGCSSGNCGACKCKVISGAVRKLREHDYVLSSKEQEAGYILACSNTAISDLVIEANEAGMADDLPYQEIRAMVRKIEIMGNDTALLSVQTPRAHSLRFKAGQQVVVTAENGSSAELSIASCPCDGRNLQFILKRGSGNGLNRLVFDNGLARQTVLLQGPTGGFVLQEESTAPVLFLAKGEGFAPIKSLVEQAITIDNAEGLKLVQVGANPPGSTLDNLCRAWADSLDNFAYTSLGEESGAGEILDLFSEALRAAPHVEFYIAGPEAWIDELRGAAGAHGLDAGQWHVQAM